MTQDDLRQQDLQDVRVLLHNKEGARFLSRILDISGVFEISYVPGDSGATAFREGARNVGLRIFADAMGSDPSAMDRLEEGRRGRSTVEIEEDF